MSAIAKLTAMLGMDPTQFKRDADDAGKAAQGLQGRLANVASGIATMFGAGMMASFALKTIKFFDDIGDAAANLDISVEKMQALNSVAVQTGVGFEQLTMALGKLKNAQSDVTTNEKLAEAFKQLGISVEDVRMLSTDDLFAKIGTAISSAKDRQAAFNAVVDIFGERIGPRLVSLLKESKTGMDEFTGSLSAADVQMIKDMADAWEMTKLNLMSSTAELMAFIGNLGTGNFKEAWDIFKDTPAPPPAELKNKMSPLQIQAEAERALKEKFEKELAAERKLYEAKLVLKKEHEARVAAIERKRWVEQNEKAIQKSIAENEIAEQNFAMIEAQLALLPNQREGYVAPNPMVNALVRIGANVRDGAKPVEKAQDKLLNIAQQHLTTSEEILAVLKEGDAIGRY